MVGAILIDKAKKLYDTILAHKLITICVLFTTITVIDSAIIVLGLFPPKAGIDPYVHLLARLILNSVVVGALYVRGLLRRRIGNDLLVFIPTYVMALGLVLGYVWMNGFFVELHPDAYVDVTSSFTFMYLLFGLLFFFARAVKRRGDKKTAAKS